MTDEEFAAAVAEQIVTEMSQLMRMYMIGHKHPASGGADGWAVELRAPGTACTVTVTPGAPPLEAWDD